MDSIFTVELDGTDLTAIKALEEVRSIVKDYVSAYVDIRLAIPLEDLDSSSEPVAVVSILDGYGDRRAVHYGPHLLRKRGEISTYLYDTLAEYVTCFKSYIKGGGSVVDTVREDLIRELINDNSTSYLSLGFDDLKELVDVRLTAIKNRYKGTCDRKFRDKLVNSASVPNIIAELVRRSMRVTLENIKARFAGYETALEYCLKSDEDRYEQIRSEYLTKYYRDIGRHIKNESPISDEVAIQMLSNLAEYLFTQVADKSIICFEYEVTSMADIDPFNRIVGADDLRRHYYKKYINLLKETQESQLRLWDVVKYTFNAYMKVKEQMEATEELDI